MKLRKYNVEGITKYWVHGEDDRELLAKQLSLDPTSEADRKAVDSFLGALMSVVKRRRRTKFVGFGVFEWKPWESRIPTGEFVKTWRLVFKPGRYVKGKYNGSGR